MPQIKFTLTKFKLDRAKFTKVVSDKLMQLMLQAGHDSLLKNYLRVPEWTGESRGGLLELAYGLGVNPSDIESNPPHPTKNKNRASGIALGSFEPPHRGAGNKVIFTWANLAEGFEFNDRQANISPTSPWRFSASFSRVLKQELRELVRGTKLPISSFSLRQRVV